ncbi:DUF6288 domain-containing protein [Phycisphaeraceae bacterium D3-23]
MPLRLPHRLDHRVAIVMAVTVAALLTVCPAPMAAAQPDVPDYTAGDTPPADGPHDWTLGPTGARGYFFVDRKRATFYARQAYIAEVAEGSPAEGVLQAGDVILGIGSEPFESDARLALARAIQLSESEQGGRLQLLRWRAGQAEIVTIQLEAMPAFSATAPYDCEKSDRLLEAGARALSEKGLGRIDLPTHINALALLATGEEAYLPMVREYAHRVAERDMSQHRGLHSWEYAYSTLLLAEYYLATRDPAVYDAVRKQAVEIAQGQSVMGNWGHRFVWPELGRLGGYGAINCVSIPLATSMVLARECGVDVPVVDEAIDRSAAFFRRYVGLGAIPYGDHEPNRQYGHDDNGKNSNAAVFFDLLGDEDATAYYRRTAVAAFNADREQGHTGNFFNILWSLPGVARGGPLATGGYLGEFGWYYDLARDWQHGYPYQGNPEARRENYHGWDCPGAYLLHLAIARGELRITGKGPMTLDPMTPEEVETALAAGRNDYPTMTDAALIEALSSWSPVVRFEAAKELRSRDVALGEDIAHMVQSEHEQDQLAAMARVEASRSPGETPQAELVFDAAAILVRDGSEELRHQAVRTLVALNPRGAAEVLLPYLASYERGADPMLSQQIVFTLLSDNPGKVQRLLQNIDDRELVLGAMRQMLEHEDPWVIQRIVRVLGQLPAQERAALMPAIVAAGSHDTPSNIMFMMDARLSCLEIASGQRIHEAIAPLADIATLGGWGHPRFALKALTQLATYGSAAADCLPQLREARAETLDNEQLTEQYDRAIGVIEGDDDPPQTVTLEAFMRQSQVGTN